MDKDPWFYFIQTGGFMLYDTEIKLSVYLVRANSKTSNAKGEITISLIKESDIEGPYYHSNDPVHRTAKQEGHDCQQPRHILPQGLCGGDLRVILVDTRMQGPSLYMFICLQ